MVSPLLFSLLWPEHCWNMLLVVVVALTAPSQEKQTCSKFLSVLTTTYIFSLLYSWEVKRISMKVCCFVFVHFMKYMF